MSARPDTGWAAQARLFEAFLALFERLAARQPSVLVMEDLHWADRSTLDLLTFRVRNRGRLTVVLTTTPTALPAACTAAVSCRAGPQQRVDQLESAL
jgi:predicted ATPase